MFRFFHRILIKLPPEMAHHWAIFFLKLFQKLVCLTSEPPQPSVAVHLKNLPEIPFKNRCGLAAGFDKNGEAFVALSKLGFGFLEVGTVTPLPQAGNAKPRLWRVKPEGLINQMGFNNCGLDEFIGHLVKLRPYCEVPVFANVGKSKVTPNELAVKDYDLLFAELTPWVDGFVVNVSSPNTPGLRDLQSIEFLEQIEKIAPEKPVFVKLAPDLDNSSLRELFIKIKSSSKFSGCVLTNTSRALALSQYQRTEGGYSGEKLFERSLEVISLCADVFQGEKTIIGVGGVNSSVRAKKMRDSGADLVEIYTGFVYQGPSLVKAIAQTLAD